MLSSAGGPAEMMVTAERQTLMFSATMPHNIKTLSDKYLSNPERIAEGSTIAVPERINQEIIQTDNANKLNELLRILESRTGTVIIFVKTKYGTEKLATKLNANGHQADAMHGDLKQKQRDRVIRAFRNGEHRILVATDIASRGLDIPHIEHVINYDMPQAPEDYIHRIGRTARAGAEGSAVCLITSDDRAKWRAIQKLMNPGQSFGRDESEGRPGRSGKKFGGGFKGKKRFDKKPFGDRPERSERPRRERSDGAPDPIRPLEGHGADSEVIFQPDRKEHKGGPRKFGGKKKFGDKPHFGKSKFRPDRAGGERKFKPEGAGGERKFRPDREGGERKFRPDRAGGERKFRPDREGGERKFRSDRGEHKPPRTEGGERKFRPDRAGGGERKFPPRDRDGNKDSRRDFSGKPGKPRFKFDRGNNDNGKPAFSGERRERGDGEKKAFGGKPGKPRFKYDRGSEGGRGGAEGGKRAFSAPRGGKGGPRPHRSKNRG
jgi:superfamily II DNA/RNA helicase